VYDRTDPGKTFQTFSNISDLEPYISADSNFKKYQFILSESGTMLAETRGFFSTRRFRELSGLGLTD
jgi:hypothetical protein